MDGAIHLMLTLRETDVLANLDLSEDNFSGDWEWRIWQQIRDSAKQAVEAARE